MAHHAIRALLAAALTAGLVPGWAARALASEAGDPGRSEQRALRILERHRARHEFPGAVLTLRVPAGEAFTVTAGLADPAQGDSPVDADTPWIIGSATKTFVAVVVLQLAQEGKLDLDAPIAPHFPELPGAGRITIRQLLQHTSGLPEYLQLAPVQREARREWSARELIAAAIAAGAPAEPGAGYHYANTNTLVLGEIVAAVTARPWYAEVRTRILEPLGLAHSGYAGEPGALRIGTGHVIEEGRFVAATERWHPSLGGAAGGMYATTADLLTFALALCEGNLLDAKGRTEMQRFIAGEDLGYVEHAYGLGLERYRVNDLTILGHMGVGSAHGAFFGYDPASRAAVAVQINADTAGPAAIMAAEALAAVTGQDVAPPPLPSASAGYSLYPYQTLTRVGSGERIGEMRVSSQQVSLSYPIVANGGRTRLDLSAGYQRLQFDHRGFTHPLASVQAISATAFLRQRLSDAWGLLLVAAPGYADDFAGGASLDALTSTLVAAGSYRFSDDLECGLGVAIQNVFGEPLPLPVASLDWTIGERLWLRSILPINAELTWLPVDALGLRAALQVTGGNYHGAESVYAVQNPQLNYSAAAAELGARWFITPFLHLTAHGGYTLMRRFEFSAGREPAPGGEYELANGPVFGLDLGLGN